ncbi:STAS domain-containing protein [Bergeriella denitrificans]|uniref:NTP binding protein n=1 Tax=Bergeriella denitrificans TaxID=494 RepID=A0A378UJ18_BERDE|nr:STAS domain-containing protein [Bergeriella denitrificans]STZ77130.1 NTP binding protein [Bergeriella denitrificans]
MNSEVRNGILYISGDVTVKTLTAAAYARFEQQCRLKNLTALDLGGVGRADSACVSLLLAARRAGGNLRPQHLPEAVRALADLYEINDWLST